MNYWEKEYTDGFFNVSKEHGFLPIREPLNILPHEYKALQDLINNLYVFQSENREEKGVLGIPNEIVEQIKFVPDYSNIIDKETDVFVLQALYRAYTFVTSGFTLEQAYQEFLQSGNYGVARQFLPKNIAQPLVLVSSKLDVYPWLDYQHQQTEQENNVVDADPDMPGAFNQVAGEYFDGAAVGLGQLGLGPVGAEDGAALKVRQVHLHNSAVQIVLRKDQAVAKLDARLRRFGKARAVGRPFGAEVGAVCMHAGLQIERAQRAGIARLTQCDALAQPGV